MRGLLLMDLLVITRPTQSSETISAPQTRSIPRCERANYCSCFRVYQPSNNKIPDSRRRTTADFVKQKGPTAPESVETRREAGIWVGRFWYDQVGGRAGRFMDVPSGRPCVAASATGSGSLFYVANAVLASSL